MTLSFEDSCSRVTCPVLETPGCVLSRGTRMSQIGLTGGEIMPVRNHYGGKKTGPGRDRV
jgi:hypothetical protein